jgi:acetylornithine deacetylase/succinyl-diaminopimelate desuccinylase-like protein
VSGSQSGSQGEPEASEAIRFIDAHRERFVRELVEWVRVPSVSSQPSQRAPFVRTIADATGKPCLLMGFGQPDENSHAPNEWLDLENYHLGIKSAAYLYDEIARDVTANPAGPGAESG